MCCCDSKKKKRQNKKYYKLEVIYISLRGHCISMYFLYTGDPAFAHLRTITPQYS